VSLQLALDGADRLVELAERRGEPIAIDEAARLLVRAARVPAAVARRLVDEVVRGDARLAWRSADEVALAAWAPAPRRLEDAVFCVVDLETTGARAAADRIVEIGAVRIVALEREATFERLVDPGVPLPAAIAALTGIDGRSLRGRGPVGPALDAFLRFAGDAVVVAHNARFDVAFLDAALRRLRGRRLACPVVDTVGLARRLLPHHRGSFGLARLAERFSTDVAPCHRALPDALATAEILLALIGRARERGAATVDDLVALSAPQARRAHARRALAEAAPRTPGTYVMRDGGGRALYVGTAGDLRRRTRSYFRGGTQARPVERILPAVERLEFATAGSAFEARLHEVALIHDLRPLANRRGARPERGVYLRLDDGPLPRLAVVAGCGLDGATYLGPLGDRPEAERVAAALRGVLRLRTCRAAAPVEGDCLEGRLGRCHAPCRGAAEQAAHAAAVRELREIVRGARSLPVGGLRARRAELVAALRFEEAARLRDAESALRRAGQRLQAIRRARTRHGAVLAPHRDPALVAAFGVAFGLVVACRALPRAGGGALEAGALAAEVVAAVRAGPGHEGALAVQAERFDELMEVGRVFARPRPGAVAVAHARGDPAQLAAALAEARGRVAVREGGAPAH
jgi:DNA polymerase III subunit epsilon